MKFFYTFNELVNVNVGHLHTIWSPAQEKGGFGHGAEVRRRRPGKSPGRRPGVTEQAEEDPFGEGGNLVGRGTMHSNI